jgi:hypothetical protein
MNATKSASSPRLVPDGPTDQSYTKLKTSGAAALRRKHLRNLPASRSRRAKKPDLACALDNRDPPRLDDSIIATNTASASNP